MEDAKADVPSLVIDAQQMAIRLLASHNGRLIVVPLGNRYGVGEVVAVVEQATLFANAIRCPRMLLCGPIYRFLQQLEVGRRLERYLCG